MNIDWSAIAVHHPNGTKLFEKFDLQKYDTFSNEYDDLANCKKAQYRGRIILQSKQE